jgi:hypothetical protein
VIGATAPKKLRDLVRLEAAEEVVFNDEAAQILDDVFDSQKTVGDGMAELVIEDGGDLMGEKV